MKFLGSYLLCQTKMSVIQVVSNLKLINVSQRSIRIAWDYTEGFLDFGCDRNFCFRISLCHENESSPRYEKDYLNSFVVGGGFGAREGPFPRESQQVFFEDEFPERFSTGVYQLEVSVRDHTNQQHWTVSRCEPIKVVIPTVGALSSGGSCFLIDGALFGINNWCVLTNHHALNTQSKASTTSVLFNNTCMVCLKPDIFWATHSNQGATGLDYSCIAIDNMARSDLSALNMFPNQLISNPKECENTLMLIHKPCHINRFIYTMVRVTKYKQVKTHYEYLGNSTSAGSSGSPVFGVFRNAPIGEEGKIGVCGLHKAKNICVNIRDVLTDIRKNNRRLES